MAQSSRLQLVPLVFIIRDNKSWKITGVSPKLPFVTLTKSVPLALRLQKLPSGLKQKGKGLVFLGPLKYFLWFDLVGWLACTGIVLR